MHLVSDHSLTTYRMPQKLEEQNKHFFRKRFTPSIASDRGAVAVRPRRPSSVAPEPCLTPLDVATIETNLANVCTGETTQKKQTSRLLTSSMSTATLWSWFTLPIRGVRSFGAACICQRRPVRNRLISDLNYGLCLSQGHGQCCTMRRALRQAPRYRRAACHVCSSAPICRTLSTAAAATHADSSCDGQSEDTPPDPSLPPLRKSKMHVLRLDREWQAHASVQGWCMIK